jgi:heme-degrading monooxygenase HmoA
MWWKDLETLAAWRNHLRHRAARKAGRQRWTRITLLRSPKSLGISAFLDKRAACWSGR